MSPKDTNPDSGFSTDKDLNEVWPEVIAEYERVTERKLDPNTTFESFQLNVTERLRDATSKRSSNARKILNNVGQCLQQFGSIIATGASTVFGPSAQCWNAINFVLVAAQKYSEVLDGFITLMERCAAFLSRLNIFLKQECGKHGEYLPSHLRRPAYTILSHFIDILKSSYKLSKSKREKFKLVLDIVLFSGDAGVKSSLDLLERHVQDFTNIQIDQILVDVKGLARHLQESDEERRQHHTEIREHLEHVYGVSEENLAVTQQMKITLDGHVTEERNKKDLEAIIKNFGLKSGDESWVKRHDHISKTRIKDSGLWIVERNDLGFSAWADIHDRKSHAKILTVEGDAGFGKTFISNKVISHLQDSYRSNTSSDSVSIGYYYYGEDREDSLEKCLRCIIYQLASADPAYARAVAEACKQSPNIARAEDIWERLIIKLQHAMKGTYYICIDGFQQVATGDAEKTISTIANTILSEIKGTSVRLYFSGSNEAVEYIPQDKRGVRRILLGPVKDLGNKIVRLSAEDNHESAMPVINASDLEALARARIEEIGKKKSELKTVMTEANIKKLVAGIHGHYEHLEAKILQINACDTEQKIQDVIDSVGYDLKTSIRQLLKTFSESLSVEQIRQLNELLVWIVGGKYTSVEFLQSALYLEFNRTFMLKDLIATTFSGLLSLEENEKVKLKSDKVLEILREENQSHPKLSRSGSTPAELSQSEIDLCSRIVKNVCGEHVYGRFNFDDFFDSLAGKQRESIQVDDENALNVVITRSLLKALCEPKADKNLDAIRRYAVLMFHEHLQYFVEQLDFFEADRDTLADIGSKLSHLLHESEAINAWLSNEHIGFIEAETLVGDDFIEPVLKILRNPRAARGYEHDEEKNKWIQSAISSKSNKYAILAKVASTTAIKWFSCRSLISREYFWIPYSVFSKEKTGEYDPEAIPSLVQIADFLQWVKDHCEIDTTGAIWSFRVGAIYGFLDHTEEAIRVFKEVESQLQENWAFLLNMAEAHGGIKDFPAALSYLHKIKQLYPMLIDNDEDFKQQYWTRVLLPEASFHGQIEEYDAAIKCYRSILDQDIGFEDYPGQVHGEAMTNLFSLWAEIEDHASILAFLQELSDTKKGGKPLSYWLISSSEVRDSLHSYIIKAAKHCEAIDEVCRIYEEAISAKLDNEPETKGIQSDNIGILEAMTALFSLWAEIKDYASILTFLRDMKKGGRPLHFWLVGSHGTQDSFHGHIIKAAKYCEAIDEVYWIYDDAIDANLPNNPKTQSVENVENRVGNLRYYRAALQFYGSRLDKDHEEALRTWEEIIGKCKDFWTNFWPAYNAIGLLAPSLLDKGSVDAMKMAKPATVNSYVGRLEALSRSDQFIIKIARQYQNDPRFCLLRLYLLCGNQKLADEEATTLLRGAFDDWPKDPNDQSLRMRFAILAQVLSIFDLEEDAVAAWQALKPRGIKNTATGESRVVTPNPESEQQDEQSVSPTPKAEAYISGYYCDACETPWKDVLSDNWACKHCLCVQLCSPCHQKLLNDELNPFLCSKEHQFLYLPKFDETIWSSVPDNMMLVGGKLILREQWLHQFRERWGVQQEQIDAYKLNNARQLKAANYIAKYVSRWVREFSNRRRKITRARTFPLHGQR